MNTINIYCDYCHKKTTDEGKVKEQLNGFCIEIGYSKGGWGTRRDFIPTQSVEICDNCFKEVEALSLEFKNKIKKLHPCYVAQKK